MDLCKRIVEAVEKNVGRKLEVKYQLVTSANRIPLLANGTVDMECGSTTNNADRQKQIAYAPTTFVTANRIVYKKNAGIKKLADLARPISNRSQSLTPPKTSVSTSCLPTATLRLS
jgi:glutamate/aspartate transport system substrate-binding protein